MQLSNRGREYAEFSKLMMDHIENYTVKQYGDMPDDQAYEWSRDSCVENIKKYCNRWEGNMRGEEDRKLSLLKIAHYACIAYFKESKKDAILKEAVLARLREMCTTDLQCVMREAESIIREREVICEVAKSAEAEKTLPSPPYYRCTKCGELMLPLVKESGPHATLHCIYCNAYIKHAGSGVVNMIMSKLAELDNKRSNKLEV